MRKAMMKIPAFLKVEAMGGYALFTAALLALLAVNSPFEPLYQALLTTSVGVNLPGFSYAHPLLEWVNDGLMTIFFLLVSMEIKREMLEGHLHAWRQALLPVAAAMGGVILPALLYMAVTRGDAALARGWAIPTATDIAFSLAVLALLGKRVPVALKIFLTAVAVIDDLAAILIIALFYHQDLAFIPLAVAAFCVAFLWILNRNAIHNALPYIFLGLLLWAAVLQSGIHATMAGVILGFMIPLRGHSPNPLLRRMERKLHPWVTYAILPVFAFCNAGVSLDGLSFSSFGQPLPLGIILGLFIGKQTGIFGVSWAMVKCGFAQWPQGCGWRETHAVAVIAGIGFTMSLFIGGLAFETVETGHQIRLGVIMGSLLSAVIGYLLLRRAVKK